MADDDIFSQAGFNVSRKDKPEAVQAPQDAPSIFEAAGFKPRATQPPQSPSWEDIEAAENAAALGIQLAPSTPPQPKQGRGLLRALIDYPGHVLSGLADTIKYPGQGLMGEIPPQTLGDIVPNALNMASMASGAEFPRAGVAAATEAATSGRALNALVNAIGPENVPQVVNRLQSNPRLSIADVSDPVRTMTQGLVDPSQPKVQNLVAQTVKDRQATLPSAVNSAYTAAMGPAPDVLHMVEGLKNRARQAGQQAIQPALENASLVDTSPVIAAIDEKLQPGVNPLLSGKSELPLSPEQQELARFKQQLISGSGEQLFDAQRLHRIQSDIGDRAYQLQKSPDPKDRFVGGELRDMNEKLIDQIDAATGGAYRPARQQFKDAKDIEDAFESGFDTLKNRSGVGGLQDRPEAFADWMKNASPEEIVARRLGTRSDIDQKIRSVKNQALAGQTITKIDYNQQKLKMLFGDQEASRLIQVMKDAEDEAATNYKMLQGSKTAETLAGREALKVRDVKKANALDYGIPFMTEMLGTQYGIPGAGAAMMALRGGHLGLQKVGQWADMSRNYEFAKNALATGLERQSTINALLSHPQVVRQLEKRSNALTAK